ncbi:MAG: outer membrane protein assembly factor BamD [Oceanococcus sp.]
MSRLQHRLIHICSLCTVLVLASCASDGGSNSPGSLRDDPLRSGALDEQRVARLSAQQLYRSAREALNSSDYTTALQLYDRLDALYPFTEFATQGRLEGIYAHYRAFSPELALSAADRFMRANPRHEHLDYVLYLRGLVNFDRGATDLLDMLDIDSSTRDPINARRAFDDFGRLVRRFPSSAYAPDARQRMVYLRERIARHEMSIARFYEKRRAWVATSRRAQDIINKYQGSAVMPEALAMLERSYLGLGLEDRASEIRAVRLASFPEDMKLAEPAKPQQPAENAAPPTVQTEEANEASAS